jgi:phosphoglycolate phosphatase-like HAD superfamily hydrolase
VRRPIVVLDIDGVLADVRHRLHYLAAHPKNWDAFFAAAKDDDILDVGAEFARQAAATHDVLYLTGRPERLRAATQTWLDRHALPPGTLLMRGDNDRRRSSAIKLQALRALRRTAAVELLVDDDPSVVTAARAAGFTVQHADWMPTPSRRRPADPSDADALFGSDLLHEAQGHDGQT